MPFFFLLPLWLLCIVVAVISLLSRKYRYMAAHLALCSTGALIGCLTLFLAAVWALGKLHEPSSTEMGIVFLVVLIGSTALGGILGLVGGFLVARSLNRALGWSTPSRA